MKITRKRAELTIRKVTGFSESGEPICEEKMYTVYMRNKEPEQVEIERAVRREYGVAAVAGFVSRWTAYDVCYDIPEEELAKYEVIANVNGNENGRKRGYENGRKK